MCNFDVANIHKISDLKSTKWLKQMAKLYSNLTFDDIIDDYKSGITNFLNSFKDFPVLQQTLLATRACEAIDRADIYYYFLMQYHKKCNLEATI